MSALFGEQLQRAYSIKLYDAAGRVPSTALRVLWLSLLPDSELQLIQQVGVCPLHSRYMQLPFYTPNYAGSVETFIDENSRAIGDAEDLVWIGRNVGYMRESAAANHSWIEVTHCGTGLPLPFALPGPAPAWRRVLGPAWFYHAPGSGVSINVGRTAVMELKPALALIESIFKRVRASCDEDGRSRWRFSRRSDNHSSEEVWDELAIDDTGHPRRARFFDELELDSIQIVGHKEYYSAELKFEIILLREAECAPVTTMRRVRCQLRYTAPHTQSARVHSGSQV